MKGAAVAVVLLAANGGGFLYLIWGTGERPVVAEPPAADAIAATTRPSESEDRIRHIQNLLARLGYDPGPLDGTLNPQAHAAIKLFQRVANLKGPDGRINQAFLDRLEAAVEAQGLTNIVAQVAANLRQEAAQKKWVGLQRSRGGSLGGVWDWHAICEAARHLVTPHSPDTPRCSRNDDRFVVACSDTSCTIRGPLQHSSNAAWDVRSRIVGKKMIADRVFIGVRRLR